jgi:hypothetical protein
MGKKIAWIVTITIETIKTETRIKKTKKKEQSFLTSPCHQELTPSPGSHPPVRFPACSLKRGDVEFEKNYCVDTTKHKTHGKRGVEDVLSCTSHGQY